MAVKRLGILEKNRKEWSNIKKRKSRERRKIKGKEIEEKVWRGK